MGKPVEITRNEFIAALRHIELTEGPVTQRDFARRMAVSESTVGRVCGNWNKLRKEAGLAPAVGGRWAVGYESSEIVERLREIVQREGKHVTFQRFERLTGISATTIGRHFGSWKDLRGRLGLPPNKTKNRVYTDAEILDDVEAVIRKLGGRFPTVNQLNALGRCGQSTYLRRFGSTGGIRKALSKHRIAKELHRRAARRQPAVDCAGQAAPLPRRADAAPLADCTPACGPDGEWVFPPDVAKTLEEMQREHDALLDNLLAGLPEPPGPISAAG